MTKPWYVVQSVNAKQTLARFYLEQQGYRVLWLRYQAHEVRSEFGRKAWKSEPLFGNYMFVQADLTDAVDFQSVKNTRGVQRILGDTAPKIVPPLVMDALLALGEDGIVDRVQALASVIKYAKDQMLQITDGPFAGYIGKCLESRGERITLFLSVLGGENRVGVRHDQVIRADEPEDGSAKSTTSGAARRRMRKGFKDDFHYDKVVSGKRAYA